MTDQSSSSKPSQAKALPQWPWGLLALQAVVGLGAVAVPGVRNAGYKSFLILGVVGSLVLPLAWLSRRWGRDVLWPVWRRARAYMLLAMVPAALLFAGAFVLTKACEVDDGAAMFAIGYLPGALLAFGLTEVAHNWGQRWRHGVYVAVWLMLLVQAVGWFMAEPVYQVAHPLAGMLLGPPNEKPAVMTARAGWFALEVLGWSGVVLSLVTIFDEGWRSARWWRYVSLGLSAALVTGLVWQDAELGYRIDERYMRGELSAIETRNGIEHVMAANMPSDARPWMMVDAEFEWERQRQLFGLEPKEMPKTTIYWHRNRTVKRKLTGASRTKFAKVHLGELYISADSFPVSTLAHELAHVTSGAFSDTPLKVPGRLGGVWYNPALVEGFAVAVAWTDFPLSAHEQARRALKKKRAPRLEELFSPLGFATTNLSVAYRISGSFVRYCLDTYGPEPVVAWYRSQDFEAAFGMPLAEVEGRWKAMLLDESKVAMFSSDLERVDRIQKRPSIAQESCGTNPLEKALRNAISAEADDEVERILELQIAQKGLTDELWFTGEQYRARRQNYDCEVEVPEDLELSAKIERRANFLKGLARWKRGDKKAAKALFDALPKTSKKADNVIQARILMRDGYALDEYISDAPVDPVVHLMAQWDKRKHPIFGYRLALKMRRGQRWESLSQIVSQIDWSGVDFPDGHKGTLLLGTHKLRGEAAFATRRWSEARKAFKAYLQDAPTEGRRAYARTWLERIDFFEANQDRLPANLPRL